MKDLLRQENGAECFFCGFLRQTLRRPSLALLTSSVLVPGQYSEPFQKVVSGSHISFCIINQACYVHVNCFSFVETQRQVVCREEVSHVCGIAI